MAVADWEDGTPEESGEESERLWSSLAAEREAQLEIELELDEQRLKPTLDEPPAKKKLKRELRQEALARLESAARTVSEFQNVVDWWDKLDANRERRERYHEVSRSGDDVPLDYGAREDGLCFPDTLNNVLERQERRGDFLDRIFNCPYEMQELVTEAYLSEALAALSEDHREVLFFSAIRLYSSDRIGKMRGQTGRNIRKVRNTALRKIHKKILPALRQREETGQPMTMEERRFLVEMKDTNIDKDGGNSYNK